MAGGNRSNWDVGGSDKQINVRRSGGKCAEESRSLCPTQSGEWCEKKKRLKAEREPLYHGAGAGVSRRVCRSWVLWVEKGTRFEKE